MTVNEDGGDGLTSAVPVSAHPLERDGVRALIARACAVERPAAT